MQPYRHSIHPPQPCVCNVSFQFAISIGPLFLVRGYIRHLEIFRNVQVPFEGFSTPSPQVSTSYFMEPARNVLLALPENVSPLNRLIKSAIEAPNPRWIDLPGEWNTYIANPTSLTHSNSSKSV